MRLLDGFWIITLVLCLKRIHLLIGVAHTKTYVSNIELDNTLVNPSLVEWERSQPCGVDWHEQMRGLVHAFVEPRLRVNLWKLFNDRPYCGQFAHDYLSLVSMNSPLANSYSYCTVCAGHVPATYKHLFWDCPTINGFWIVVQNLYQRMGSESPVNSYYSLATFIDKNHMHGTVMVIYGGRSNL